MRVLITKPEQQAATLAREISALGVEVVVLPAIQIMPCENPAAITQAMLALPRMQVLIFISPNAVHFSMPHIDCEQLATDCELCVMGSGTAHALAEYGLQQSIMPSTDFSAEGLLDALNINGRHLQRGMLLRGAITRGVISDALTQDLDEFMDVVVYQQQLPQYTDNELRMALHQLDCIVISSAQALKNIMTLAQQIDFPITDCALLVSSARIHRIAKSLGFEHIHLAENAQDASIITTLTTMQQEET